LAGSCGKPENPEEAAMRKRDDYSIVAVEQFIQATRDSGYKNTATAVAELVDNSLEADAASVEIRIAEFERGGGRGINLMVIDDGTGMTPSILRLALRFGGSTRFESRRGVGRYGMGLPNSSLSQTRRVDVYTWTMPNAVWWSYLDVSEIASGKISDVPKPKRRALPKTYEPVPSKSGTTVVWSDCDRVSCKKAKTLAAKLHEELGRIFRVALRGGKSIRINGELVRPFDPLYLHKGNNLRGGVRYGPTIKYEVKAPGRGGHRPAVSTVHVTFSELPVGKWHRLSNDEKRAEGITKRAGVSILRAGREIDYGWFFMGSKRKENYDDWWRCEVHFDAELDELFGVTHTKQGVHPSGEIISILTPDMERIAHELNGRVRKKFLSAKTAQDRSAAVILAESRDYLIEPPARLSLSPTPKPRLDEGLRWDTPGGSTHPGFAYRIVPRVLKEVSFYVPLASEKEVLILLNEEHPFYERVYSRFAQAATADKKVFRQFLELLILSAARAECGVVGAREKACVSSLRKSWSNVLAAFLA
jgi:Histidine kinase-, DNA gyrase B-, and HSP90-like ATPase